MTNLFQRIGNKIEKRKKERENFLNKYWKLSASERIDYDNKLNQIKKDTERNPFNFQTTKWASIAVLAPLVFIGVLIFGINYPLSKFIELLRPLSLKIGKLILTIFLLEIIYNIYGLIFTKDSKELILKLNKRFKI